MSNIISFPGAEEINASTVDNPCDDEKLTQLRNLAEGVLDVLGVPDNSREAILEEYLSLGDMMFGNFEVSMKIPRSINLTDEQLDGVVDSHQKTINEVFEIHRNKMNNLSAIILKLICQKHNGLGR